MTLLTMSTTPLSGLTGMPTALALVECCSTQALRQKAAQLLCEHLGLVLAECLYINSSGRWLGRDGHEVQFDCGDFSHPYAHVIHTGKPLTLSVSDARSRLDHLAFQKQISHLPSAHQLHLRPLQSAHKGGKKQWLGVLMLSAESPQLAAFNTAPEVAAFEELLCHLWARLVREKGERHRSTVLKASLEKLSDEARRQALADQLGEKLLGQSTAMQVLRRQIIRAAETTLTVLLQGQTGTGKDCIAKAIHDYSARANAPFVAINCAAIPETLLESELFGHVKGAFSGANQSREGLMGQANGGTLFLDEIGDLPLAIQSKLLRAIESGYYRPLGSNQERHANLRLIAATHQPLRALMHENSFRADLYYRLNQFPLKVPGLTERKEDIPQLVHTFIADFCASEKRAQLGITLSAMQALMQRDYPGNIRELKNVTGYACAVTPSGEDIDLHTLSGKVAANSELHARTIGPWLTPIIDEIDDLRQTMQEVEVAIIDHRLKHFNGNRAKAAESLGLPKRTLAHKCKQLRLDTK